MYKINLKEMSTLAQQDLLVCWVRPTQLTSKVSRILSFLRPSEEDILARSIFEKNLISARVIAQEVNDDALKLYTELVAHIGAEKVYKGSSLRELLKTNNGDSRWWYHPVSFKDCEVDPTFSSIIQVLVIDKIASEDNFRKIVLLGADDTIASVLKSKYKIECIENKNQSTVYRYLRAFGSRIKQFIEHVYHWHLIKQSTKETQVLPDLLLEGFWDWSVRPNKQQDGLNDRYFKSLPELLKQRGIKTAWLLWFSPRSEPGLRHRHAKDVLKKAGPYNNLIFLQKYINLTDIVKAFIDYRPAIKYFLIVRTHFKDLFSQNGFNLFPLFRDQLLYHFLSSSIPHHVLVEKACRNAFMKFKPKMALTFLEMFPYSRAFYAGARQGYPAAKLATIQHASYSRGKTFIRFDLEIEFNGKPDNCPIPKPDYVFVMGELGKEIFQECGFAPQDIFLTGSARYEQIRTDSITKSHTTPVKIFNLLLVTTLDRDIEMDMVEAVYVAAKKLPQIKLCLRNHPLARIDEHPLFKPLRYHITIMNGTLEEDLEAADLILFTYSTVAEEAFIRGIPVWQWCSTSYNGSAFRDVRVIPTFCSVSDLRESLKKFIQNPTSFLSEEITRRDVLNRCFYSGDGKSAERIASVLIELDSQPHRFCINRQ